MAEIKSHTVWEKYLTWKQRFLSRMTPEQEQGYEFFLSRNCPEDDLCYVLFGFSSKEFVPPASTWEEMKSEVAPVLSDLRNLEKQLRLTADSLRTVRQNPNVLLVVGSAPELALVLLVSLEKVLRANADTVQQSVASSATYERPFDTPPFWLALFASRMQSLRVTRFYPKLATLMPPAFTANQTTLPEGYDGDRLGKMVRLFRQYMEGGQFIDDIAVRFFPVTPPQDFPDNQSPQKGRSAVRKIR